MLFITGIGSGLGRYLHENLGGAGLARSTPTEDIEKIGRGGVDTIIHCAFNAAKDITTSSLYAYLSDNILLTERLTYIPHKKFVFISSVDIYPKTGNPHSEEEIIGLNSLCELYGVAKLMSESIVINRCRNYLILRPSALLGKYSRRNSLIRILEEKNCVLTISANSWFNYVLHLDILHFIRFAINRDLKGIYNVVSSENVTLSDIADMTGNHVKFGNYHYDVGNINNTKIVTIFPAFNKTSIEVIKEFAKDRA